MQIKVTDMQQLYDRASHQPTSETTAQSHIIDVPDQLIDAIAARVAEIVYCRLTGNRGGKM
jgi:hypothetical protein